LGANGLQDVCVENNGTVEAEEGNKAEIPNALNTRFDIYPNSDNNYGCKEDGSFCPVENTRKDQAREEKWEWKNQTPGDIPSRPACDPGLSSTTGNPTPKINVSDWDSIPSSSLPAASKMQGFPRDDCHYSGNCAEGNFGNGAWARSAYLAAMPFGASVPDSATTRFQIYEWEKDPDNAALDPILVNSGDSHGESCNGGKCTYTWTNYCAYPSPINADAPVRDKDGRILTIAAVDCAHSVSSHEFRVLKWIDVFLVEPSLDRTIPYTRKDQIYGELIGEAERPGGGTGFQYYGKRKAVLIR